MAPGRGGEGDHAAQQVGAPGGVDGAGGARRRRPRPAGWCRRTGRRRARPPTRSRCRGCARPGRDTARRRSPGTSGGSTGRCRRRRRSRCRRCRSAIRTARRTTRRCRGLRCRRSDRAGARPGRARRVRAPPGSLGHRCGRRRRPCRSRGTSPAPRGPRPGQPLGGPLEVRHPAGLPVLLEDVRDGDRAVALQAWPPEVVVEPDLLERGGPVGGWCGGYLRPRRAGAWAVTRERHRKDAERAEQDEPEAERRRHGGGTRSGVTLPRSRARRSARRTVGSSQTLR